MIKVLMLTTLAAEVVVPGSLRPMGLLRSVAWHICLLFVQLPWYDELFFIVLCAAAVILTMKQRKAR